MVIELASTGGNLPVQITSFVGRRADVAGIRAALRQQRLLTVIGPGGVGKTRLALEAASQSTRSFPSGCWFIDLGRAGVEESVTSITAHGLGLVLADGDPGTSELVDRLRTRKMLIVMDNCEHRLDEVVSLLEHLISRAPEVTILATSRQALGVPGEHLVEVGGLDRPSPGATVSTAELATFESVALFIDRGRSVVPDFELTASNTSAVAQIVVRLDGLPLAIELAAARLRVLSPAQIATRLENQFRLLGVSRGVVARHHTLHATVDWSWQLCSEPERLCWARLSVFPDDFDVVAAEAVVAGGGIRLDAVLDLVAALVEKSIVMAVRDAEDGARYRLPASIREFGRDLLAELESNQAARTRHLQYFGQFVAGLPDLLFGPAQVERATAFRQERANLEAAFERAIEEGDIDTADGLASSIALSWFASGALGEAARVLQVAAKQDAASSSARVQMLCLWAWISLHQGDVSQARSCSTEARRLAQRINDLPGLGRSLQYLAECDLAADDVSSADRHCEQALELAHRVGDDHLAATTLVRKAQLLLVQRRMEPARAALVESISVSEQHGELWCRAFAQWNLALLEHSLGNPAEALGHARAVLESKGRFEDVVGVGQALEVIAWCAAELREERWAAQLLGAADRIWHSTGAVLPPQLTAQRRACEATVEAALGPDAAASLRSQGRLMLPADVLGAPGTASKRGGSPAEAPGGNPLTRREREVALLVADGLKNSEIAERLVISPRTAEVHVQHILEKLGFTARGQIAAWTAYELASD